MKLFLYGRPVNHLFLLVTHKTLLLFSEHLSYGAKTIHRVAKLLIEKALSRDGELKQNLLLGGAVYRRIPNPTPMKRNIPRPARATDSGPPVNHEKGAI